MSEKWIKLANEYGASLFPVFGIVLALEKMSEEMGNTTPFMFSVERGNSEYFTLHSGWLKTHKKLINLIKSDPNYLRNVYKKISELGLAQAKNTEVALGDIKEWSNEEINKFYQNFVISNTEIYRYGVILVLLDFQRDTFLSDEVERILKEHDAIEHSIILTTPLQNTYGRQQDIDLLKLLVEVKNGGDLDFLIKKHLQKYAWVYYVYEGPALDEKALKEMINDLEKREVDPVEELLKIEKEAQELKNKQSKIFSELDLSDYEKNIIELARDAVFYKPYRRELQTWSYYHMEPVLREIAKRFNLSLAQIRMMLPNEISKLLLNDIVDVDLLNKRLEDVLFGFDGSFFILAGREAREFIEKNAEKQKISISDHITGNIAYPAGVIKGVVRIINTYDDIVKMNEGDILVSSATSPNLMPAIRKAVAIVTDEGGLTCHAAIVSRELKIPCIIGTKFATKIFKDGDTVEVDAERGVVKKCHCEKV